MYNYENINENAWYLLGKEFAKLSDKDIQVFYKTKPYLRRDFFSKNEFIDMCNYANTKCANARTASAKQAYMTDSENKYVAGQQMFLFNWGMESVSAMNENVNM